MHLFKSVVSCIKKLFKRFKRHEILPLVYGIDRWNRHKIVERELKDCGSILNLGSGIEEELATLFLPQYANIVFLDLQHLNSKSKNMQIIGDMRCLPIRNNLFDAVIAIDSIEHISKKSRFLVLKEMLRVTNDLIIIHSPLDNPPKFLGRKYDLIFLKINRRLLGYTDLNTYEHVISGHPTLEEFLDIFPNSKVIGTWNCHIWLLVMTMQSTIVFRPIAWVLYLLFLKRLCNKNPFYSCKLVYHKFLNPENFTIND